jgi:dTDP-4-dehydrorhamnose 3,5-epimerase
MIQGIMIKQLKVIPDERGRLMEIMRCDEGIFQKFGQVYITTNYPQVVKAWHCHKVQTDYICCIKGTIKVVLYDSREGSSTYGQTSEFIIGDYNPLLIIIPPEIYHGWQCISTDESIVLCVPTEPYNYTHPDEYRLPPDTPDIPYKWNLVPCRRHG